MTKKIISLTAAVLLMMALLIPAVHADTTMYVYTENGGTLNVRSSERIENNVIGTLPYGAQVTVRSSYNGWSHRSCTHGSIRSRAATASIMRMFRADILFP